MEKLKLYINPPIDYTELSSDFQTISDLIGIENLRLLLHSLPGYDLYIPKAPYFKEYLIRFIKSHQGTTKQIAIDIGVSQAFINKLLRLSTKSNMKLTLPTNQKDRLNLTF